MITLQVYVAPSGQWSGRLLDENDEELGGIAGCDYADEVVTHAMDSGWELDSVVYFP